MKQYKLIKDLPTFKAGQLAYISERGNLIAGTPDNPETTDARIQLMMYHKQTIDKFPEILTEWFEEIQEPTDSIHWKPKHDEKIWYLDENGDTNFTYFDENDTYHIRRVEFGNTYRTADECEQARERKLAEVRLRRTSTFEPDFEDDGGGYIVYYDHYEGNLEYGRAFCHSVGEPVRYETIEESEESAKKHRKDWLIYFGVEEE
jgi:hypothetical protein|nr:MAG TPA: hypothetical protein [Caudoviricetes sp.]